MTDSVSQLATPRRPLGRRWRQVSQAVAATGFWAAVILPFVYLPPLIVGTWTLVSPAVVVGVGLNLLGILVGQGYEPPRSLRATPTDHCHG